MSVDFEESFRTAKKGERCEAVSSDQFRIQIALRKGRYFNFFNFLLINYLFVYYIYSILSARQKRDPDRITDGCEPPYGCWELNSGPLEE